jgi:hypothetical protein
MEEWSIRGDSSWICGAQEEARGIQARGRGRLTVKAGIGVGKMRRWVRKRQISRVKLIRRGGGNRDENVGESKGTSLFRRTSKRSTMATR